MLKHAEWPKHLTVQPHHSTPPFKGKLLVIEKWARYQNDQHDKSSSLVPRSTPYEHSKHAEQPNVWPFSPTINPTVQRTIGHRKMSQVSKQSVWWNEFIGTKISSIWTFKICRMTKMFDHSAPPFKKELLVIEKQARYWNDQEDKMSSLVPRSAPYEHSKCEEWPKCLTIHPHHSTSPFKRDNFPIQLHKIHQHVQLNEQTKFTLWDLLSTADSPTNSTANNMFRVYIYWRFRSSRHGKCSRTMNMISLKINSLVFSL